jgi:AraC family ethanolamine operon transcriptional activator
MCIDKQENDGMNPIAISIPERFKPFGTSRLFHDFDEWTTAFSHLSLTATQLSPGKFKGELAIANLGYLQLIYASTNQAMHIVGGKPPNTLIFATPLTAQDGALISHDQRLNQNVLFGFDPTRDNHVITHKSCQVGMVLVNTNLFHDYTDQMGRKPFKDVFFRQNVISLDPINLNDFKSYLLQLLYVLQTNPSWLQQPQAQKLIIEDGLPLLIDTLRTGDALPLDRITSLKRYPKIKAMSEFMMANIDQPLTLKDLYTAAKTSPRALSYGVQDLFAMSPMEYVKVNRLNGVRRMLKTSNPQENTISAIATQWGFWSMGHFSRDYKRLFGESPSETLKKS